MPAFSMMISFWIKQLEDFQKYLEFFTPPEGVKSSKTPE